ncbi:transcription initiation factor TFIIIB, Brf1 subunit/transcription initiation factor TFIIB [Caldisphaera lagunensis DSM 15908]|uniref:Transcription initiation factor TFIIIB, Brf1 subunit/transcription initiation factor TFIIB n=1 Tax=Caldisphaera lagunensis (strain DSM 15908 / JCM 11604 / ANMR 0165 / IC-154) TaxID=1056495 RepID=L0A9M1_CALLD|nr:transcription initiation factor IIB family protein [Caldisphaera lagunensis]AFZ69842.1 transcription initiation factor TFIIIB, Brf1 subunit/transcription initiation factor TFIIB [Caldisphaera lagunensis DSM 15908]
MKCPRCSSDNLVTTIDGKLVCQNCGLVVDENLLADRPEWRSYNEKGIQNTKGVERASQPETLLRHDKGSGALVFTPPKSRNLLKSFNSRRISMRHATSRSEMPQIAMFSLANKLSEYFNLPRSASQTLGLILHEYIEKNGGSVGKYKEAIIAAAFAKVVELYNLNISQSEIEEFMEIDSNKLWEGKKKLNDLGILSKYRFIESENMGYTDSKDRMLTRVVTYINRIVSSLNLNQTIIEQSISFVKESLSSGKTLYGKKPEAIAAATVYLISRLNGHDISQKEIAETVSIKESTVRKLYKFLITNMSIVVYV